MLDAASRPWLILEVISSKGVGEEKSMWVVELGRGCATVVGIFIPVEREIRRIQERFCTKREGRLSREKLGWIGCFELQECLLSFCVYSGFGAGVLTFTCLILVTCGVSISLCCTIFSLCFLLFFPPLSIPSIHSFSFHSFPLFFSFLFFYLFIIYSLIGLIKTWVCNLAIKLGATIIHIYFLDYY